MQDHIALEGRIGGYEAHDQRREAIEGALSSDCRAGRDRATQHRVHRQRDHVLHAGAVVDPVPARRRRPHHPQRLHLEPDRVPLAVRALRGRGRARARPPRRRRRRRGDGRPHPRAAARLVCVTHVPTNSGLVQAVAAIGAACREHEVLYLVDACQSIGQMPIDVGGSAAITCRRRSASSCAARVARDFSTSPIARSTVASSRSSSTCAARIGSTPNSIARWQTPGASRLGVRLGHWCSRCGAAARYATAIGLAPIRDPHRRWRRGCDARSPRSTACGCSIAAGSSAPSSPSRSRAGIPPRSRGRCARADQHLGADPRARSVRLRRQGGRPLPAAVAALLQHRGRDRPGRRSVARSTGEDRVSRSTASCRRARSQRARITTEPGYRRLWLACMLPRHGTRPGCGRRGAGQRVASSLHARPALLPRHLHLLHRPHQHLGRHHPDGEGVRLGPRRQGTVLSAFFVGYMLTQILGGRLADRFGGKVVLAGGVMLWSLFTMITPLAASLGFARVAARARRPRHRRRRHVPCGLQHVGRWVPTASAPVRSRSTTAAFRSARCSRWW